MSEPKAPAPVVKTFLLCREVFQDSSTKEFILVGPTVELVAPQYPHLATVHVYAQLTSLHGSYRFKLQLHDTEGAVVWSQDLHPPIQNDNPLLTIMVAFHRLPILIPKAGKYDLILLINGVEAGRYGFAAGFPKPPKPTPAAEPPLT